ncbi:hypothetical protein CPB83DRAFT_784999 [Crepidotus variabilis]|uniref:FAD-binding domain-containing protein n=1 Tax=Crepidotus variabilis TaxID=179855 RepID=A0A9P6JTR9_9AGAR|nr:hypothetical protein CPB83DRAFT_784999 [Crepidotus variabilis]
MKVIIVGAGIGGLSTYLAFKKHISPLDPSLQIKILESHSSPRSQTLASGGGLGLAPNGLRSIASITTNAISHIQARGFAGTSMTFRNDKGGMLGVMAVGRRERYGYDMMMMTRAGVHDALLSEIEDESVIRWGVKVIGVEEINEGEGGVLVELADGTIEKADLLVGADGVRSIVKDYLFKGEYQAQYDGLTGLGGFLPLSSIPTSLRESLPDHPVTMIFGRLGFLAYSVASPLSDPDPLFMWWSIYETDSLPDRTNIDYEDVKRQLLHRSGSWKSPYDATPRSQNDATKGIYRQLIELGCVPPSDAPLIPTNSNSSGPASSKSMSTAPRILPRYVTPRLPYWSNATAAAGTTSASKNRGRIFLLGDAAHTMPPDVGQGVSCAAEDAVVYALLLKHYISNAAAASPTTLAVSTTTSIKATATDVNSPTSVLEQTAIAYESIRKPNINKLLDLAKRSGDMKKELSWFGQVFRDLMMKLVLAFKLPETFNDVVFAYDPEEEVRKYITKASGR